LLDQSDFVYYKVMVRTAPYRRYAPILPAAAISAMIAAVPASALQVTAQADVQAVRVGEKVTVTITATRSDSLGDPQFAGAGIQAGPSWKLGGQLTQSPTRIGAHIVKSWRFDLLAASPDSTRVIPVVYLGGDPSLGHRADSILGAPLYLIIMPAPVRPVWPWFVGAALVVSVPAYLIVRSLRKKRDDPFERPVGSPLEEALEMLEAIRVNRREDRAQRYLADLERVLDGYISKRTGQSLAGMTATEVADLVGQKINDQEVRDLLWTVLQVCVASRFGGVQIPIGALVALDERALQTLERMDKEWV
jgi:hypothetical protein